MLTALYLRMLGCSLVQAERIPKQQKDSRDILLTTHRKKNEQVEAQQSEDKAKLQNQQAAKQRKFVEDNQGELNQLQMRWKLKTTVVLKQHAEARDKMLEQQQLMLAKLNDDHHDRLAALRQQQADEQQLFKELSFVGAWNFADALLHQTCEGKAERYLMLRQAMMARRALLIIDDIDLTDAARDRIERHIMEVLAPQGHLILVISRPAAEKDDLSARFPRFHRFSLVPLVESRQQHAVEQRLGSERAVAVMNYVRSLPLDTLTRHRVTANPLILSMLISYIETRPKRSAMAISAGNDDAALLKEELPQSSPQHGAGAETYSVTDFYEQATRAVLQRVYQTATDVDETSATLLTPLLMGAFFVAHAAGQRILTDAHLLMAARLLARQRLARSSSGAVAGALRLLHHGMALEFRLPLLSRLSVNPLGAIASHHSIQEFFVAKAICDGVRLPHPPWLWDEWWAAVVVLGAEMGSAFTKGLFKASGLTSTAFDVAGRVAGHRPTAMQGVALLMHVAASVNLSRNRLGGSGPEVVDEHAEIKAAVLARRMRASGERPSSQDGGEPLGLRSKHREEAEEWQRVMRALRTSRSVTSLNLSHNSLTDEHIAQLAAALAESATCRSLDVSGNSGISLIGGLALATLAMSSEELAELFIDSQYALPVMQLKGTAPDPVDSLSLECKGLRAASAAVIGILIGDNPFLRHLDLSNNALGHSSGRVLGEALRVNDANGGALEHVVLSFTDLGDEGAVGLAEGLAQNQTIRVLELQGRYKGNNIGPRGARALAEAVASCDTLLQLNLGMNQIKDDGVRAIANALRDSAHPLHSLNVESNGIREANALCALVISNCSLRFLSAEYNLLDAAAKQKLREALMARRMCWGLDAPNVDVRL